MPPSQTGYFPAANEGIDRPVGARAEFLSAAEGQVNQKQPAEVVLDLEVRKPPARPEVEWVLNQSCERAVGARNYVRVLRRRIVVDGPGEYIVQPEGGNSQVLTHGDLQAVVVRVGPVRPPRQRGELRLE